MWRRRQNRTVSIDTVLAIELAGFIQPIREHWASSGPASVGLNDIHFHDWNNLQVVWIIRQKLLFIGVQEQGINAVVPFDL